jgi:hypothetical protein
MSIKVKSTAVAIATVFSVLSYSVPSQAGEYGYLHELETMAKQQDVKSYLDNLSISEKLERGKEYCDFLEYGSIKNNFSSLQEVSQDFFQEGYSEQKIGDMIALDLATFYASVKELCPKYEYKFNNFISEYSEEEIFRGRRTNYYFTK